MSRASKKNNNNYNNNFSSTMKAEYWQAKDPIMLNCKQPCVSQDVKIIILPINYYKKVTSSTHHNS